MARPAPQYEPIPDPRDEPPRIDTDEIDRAYHYHRAARRARIEHRRNTRRARVRFFAMLVVLVAVSVFVALTVWHEIQSLFGL
jgi:hypothetical protein